MFITISLTLPAQWYSYISPGMGTALLPWAACTKAWPSPPWRNSGQNLGMKQREMKHQTPRKGSAQPCCIQLQDPKDSGYLFAHACYCFMMCLFHVLWSIHIQSLENHKLCPPKCQESCCHLYIDPNVSLSFFFPKVPVIFSTLNATGWGVHGLCWRNKLSCRQWSTSVCRGHSMTYRNTDSRKKLGF